MKTFIGKYVRARDVKSEKCCLFVFCRFTKAFDSVWWKGLLYKKCTYGSGWNLYDIIITVYKKSSLCLKLNEEITPCFQSSCGVKQGCTIDPTLFNIYHNDLPQEIRTTGTDPVKLWDYSESFDIRGWYCTNIQN